MTDHEFAEQSRYESWFRRQVYASAGLHDHAAVAQPMPVTEDNVRERLAKAAKEIEASHRAWREQHEEDIKPAREKIRKMVDDLVRLHGNQFLLFPERYIPKADKTDMDALAATSLESMLTTKLFKEEIESRCKKLFKKAAENQKKEDND